MENTMPDVPRVAFLWLPEPAALHCSFVPWPREMGFKIQGRFVDPNDTPSVSWADVLYDANTREFAGLTFSVESAAGAVKMRAAVRGLDANVVRYVDSGALTEWQRYVECGNLERVEITWLQRESLLCQPASLVCGSWFWCYPKDTYPGPHAIPLALAVGDIDLIVKDLDLTWPRDLNYPKLDVEYF
jgi:hypothetical protein